MIHSILYILEKEADRRLLILAAINMYAAFMRAFVAD